MAADPTFAEVHAEVLQLLGTYAQALDDGRTDDLVALFCSDGTVDMPGQGSFEGHEALRGAFASWVPRVPQRHLVLNTVITDWDADQVRAVSDLVLLVRTDEGWRVQLTGRYHDVVHRTGDGWRFHHRRADFLT